MDDWVILAPTRWKELRVAIRLVNETLAELKLSSTPDKTFIGRVSRGFDFLGYPVHSRGAGSRPARRGGTLGRTVLSRLYERGVDLMIHIGAYFWRWQRWARSGLRALGEETVRRALELVGRSLGRLGAALLRLSSLRPAFANQAVGEAAQTRRPRHRKVMRAPGPRRIPWAPWGITREADHRRPCRIVGCRVGVRPSQPIAGSRGGVRYGTGLDSDNTLIGAIKEGPISVGVTWIAPRSPPHRTRTKKS